MRNVTRSSGTHTSVATRSWLPVPRMPMPSHVSSMVISSRRNSTDRISGPSGPNTGWPSCTTTHTPLSTAECRLPLVNFQRPDTRQPPSTRSACPPGVWFPAMTARGCSARMRPATSGARPAHPMPLLIMASQPTEPLMRDSSSTMSSHATASISKPPSDVGISAVNTPAS